MILESWANSAIRINISSFETCVSSTRSLFIVPRWHNRPHASASMPLGIEKMTPWFAVCSAKVPGVQSRRPSSRNMGFAVTSCIAGVSKTRMIIYIHIPFIYIYIWNLEVCNWLHVTVRHYAPIFMVLLAAVASAHLEPGEAMRTVGSQLAVQVRSVLEIPKFRSQGFYNIHILSYIISHHHT